MTTSKRLDALKLEAQRRTEADIQTALQSMTDAELANFSQAAGHDAVGLAERHWLPAERAIWQATANMRDRADSLRD